MIEKLIRLVKNRDLRGLIATFIMISVIVGGILLNSPWFHSKLAQTTIILILSIFFLLSITSIGFIYVIRKDGVWFFPFRARGVISQIYGLMIIFTVIVLFLFFIIRLLGVDN